jgi:hypothetical protein
VTRYTDELIPDSGPPFNVTLTTVLTGGRRRWHPISPVTVALGGGIFVFKQHDHRENGNEETWGGGMFGDAMLAVDLWRSDRVTIELFNRISVGGVPPQEILAAAVWGAGVAWY